jgi:magnesium-protoporphyrin O-methyltransferase
LSDCCTPKGYRTIFSEKSAHSEAKRYRRKGLDRLSRRIAHLVKERGVEGRTMLEVGGGIGAIEIELLRAGAARATNVELTPTYEEAASELLRESGFGDRVERRVGDFVEAGTDVELADYVILNRVICCYPDMPRLAGAAADHARIMLVLTFPNNRWWTRLGLTLVNLVFRVVRLQFQIFMHPPEQVLAEAAAHGLRARFNRRGFVWHVAALDRSTRNGREEAPTDPRKGSEGRALC